MLGKALDTNEGPEDVTSIRSDCNKAEQAQGYSNSTNNKKSLIFCSDFEVGQLSNLKKVFQV